MGYAEEAPYDAIHVGAAAPVVPQAVSCFCVCVLYSTKTLKDLQINDLQTMLKTQTFMSCILVTVSR